MGIFPISYDFRQTLQIIHLFLFQRKGPQKVFGKSTLKIRLFKLSKCRFFNGRKNGYFPKGLAHENCNTI